MRIHSVHVLYANFALIILMNLTNFTNVTSECVVYVGFTKPSNVRVNKMCAIVTHMIRAYAAHVIMYTEYA